MEDGDQDILETFADGDENEAPVRDRMKAKGRRKRTIFYFKDRPSTSKQGAFWRSNPAYTNTL